MGGGFFDNIWDPYSGAYAHPRARYYRPRAPVYNRYGSSVVPEERSPSNKVEENLNQKSVKTIPVTDGGAPVAVPKKASQTPVVARFKSEDVAATKIQAVYRGYVVRKTQPLKHLRVIIKVKEELENFKGKLQETEHKKKLRSDAKERLKWSEGVMALLLRLDSLQGVHPEVRLVRKAVTKELLGFQETIDSMSSVSMDELDDVIPGENIDNSDAIAPDAVEEMEIEEGTSEELNAVEQDFASGGASEECENGSDGQGIKAIEDSSSEKPVPYAHSGVDDQVIDSGAPHCDDQNGLLSGLVGETTVELVSEPSSSEADAEAPMDVENKEKISMMSPAHRMEEDGEVEPTSSQNLSPADVEIDNQEVSRVDDSAVTDVGRREEAEMDMSQSGVNGATGENPDISARHEENETPGAESTDRVDGCIIPASNCMQSMSLELQEGQPQPASAADNINALSDRALLLQVLEENRKLKDVVRKVLQWGKQQSDVIHDLTHRIAQLEEHQPPSKLLHGEDDNDRKRITNGGCPVNDTGRSRRRLEKGRKNRRQLGYIDSEDWLSAESDDYF